MGVNEKDGVRESPISCSISHTLPALFSRKRRLTWWQNHVSVQSLHRSLQPRDAVELCLLAGLCVCACVCGIVRWVLGSRKGIISRYIHSRTIPPFSVPLRLSHGKRTSKCRVCWAPGRDIEGALRRRWLVLVLVVLLLLLVPPANALVWRRRHDFDEDEEDEDDSTRAAAADGEPTTLARSRRTMMM